MSLATTAKPRFAEGQLVTTRLVYDKMGENDYFRKQISQSYTRYKNGDWGDLSEDDKKMNDDAIANNNDRILAKYNTCCGDIYIITEDDRSVTTMLFSDE